MANYKTKNTDNFQISKAINGSILLIVKAHYFILCSSQWLFLFCFFNLPESLKTGCTSGEPAASSFPGDACYIVKSLFISFFSGLL